MSFQNNNGPINLVLINYKEVRINNYMVILRYMKQNDLLIIAASKTPDKYSLSLSLSLSLCAFVYTHMHIGIGWNLVAQLCKRHNL